MTMAFDQQTPVHFSEPESTANDLVKLIRKLRWIGMEDEADRLLGELAQRCTSADDHVFETTRETD